MDLGITGRTALVPLQAVDWATPCAVRLAGEGANVAVAGRSADALASTAERVEQARRQSPSAAVGSGVRPDGAECRGSRGAHPRPGRDLVNNTGGPPPTPVAGQGRDLAGQFRHHGAVRHRAHRPGSPRNAGTWLGPHSDLDVVGRTEPDANLGLSNTLRASLHAAVQDAGRRGRRDSITSNVIVPGRVAAPTITRFLDERRASVSNTGVEDVARDSAATMASAGTARPEGTPTPRCSCAATGRPPSPARCCASTAGTDPQHRLKGFPRIRSSRALTHCRNSTTTRSRVSLSATAALRGSTRCWPARPASLMAVLEAGTLDAGVRGGRQRVADDACVADARARALDAAPKIWESRAQLRACEISAVSARTSPRVVHQGRPYDRRPRRTDRGAAGHPERSPRKPNSGS